jgi:hypothetical protein
LRIGLPAGARSQSQSPPRIKIRGGFVFLRPFLAGTGKSNKSSTLSCFLFFSAIHFPLLRGVFSVLFRQAFAKPASFIKPMTNG